MQQHLLVNPLTNFWIGPSSTEGIEDPFILVCKSLSEDLLYVNYEFNLRVCEITFDVHFSHLTDSPEWINMYFEIEELPNGYRLTTYKRIDLESSFKYSLSTGNIDGLSIDSLKLRKN